MPHYSFILACHNQWNLTEQAIQTLNESLSCEHKKRGIELIVVNNASEDQTQVEIERMKDLLSQEIEIVPIHLPVNMGYLIATHIGVSKSRGEIVTLLNNDLIFPTNWFDGIVRTLEDPSVGVAAPFLSIALGPAGVGVTFNSVPEIQQFSRQFTQDNIDKLIFPEFVIGACISMKRELLSRVGGSDFWFGMGWFEDADWSYRVRIARYKIAIVGASFVYHVGNASWSQNPDLVHAAVKSNASKFNRKWGIAPGTNTKRLVDEMVFSREKHTFPCLLEDFTHPGSVNNQNTNPDANKMLLVADWANECSQWRQKLADVKLQMATNQNASLTIWIPTTYYPADEIKDEISTLLGENQSYVNYHLDEVPPIHLLTFLNQYGRFLKVERDFVNLYLIHLIGTSALGTEVR